MYDLMIAALFVETGGAYYGLAGIEPWDEARDARLYAGPHPVIAHPPCQRWGRFWHGCPIKPHQFAMGDDGGCFAAALASVRQFGGILEHPADSHAWAHFGLLKPPRSGGWIVADDQGCDLPSLRWGASEQRLPAYAIERYGYAKARRIGMMAAIGGKNKTAIRNRTPEQFRDLLISIALSAN